MPKPKYEYSFKYSMCKVFCKAVNPTQIKLCENDCVFKKEYQNTPIKELFNTQELYKNHTVTRKKRIITSSGRAFTHGQD